MARYDDDIAGAAEAIAEDGENTIVRRMLPGARPIPDLKPWEPVNPQPVDTQVKAVWLNYNLKSSGEMYVNGTLVKATDKKVLIAGGAVADITVSDQLIRADGSSWKVVNARVLDPNGQHVLWTLQVER